MLRRLRKLFLLVVYMPRARLTVEQDRDEKDEERFREPVRGQAGTHPSRQTGPFEHEGEGPCDVGIGVPCGEGVLVYGVLCMSLRSLELWPRPSTDDA